MNSNLLDKIPSMLSGEELYNRLTDLPEYDRSIQTKNQTERILSLSTLYDIYLPSEMSIEIYSKLYLALMRSLQKKYTKATIQQSYQNHNSIIGRESRGIIGGSDSFSIIGRSGIGKTSAINRAISIVSNHQIIEFDKPAISIIPCLKVECPWDASVKSMLLSILREVDQYLGTTYSINASKKRITTDMLIGMVAQVSMQHIGILIIDEIQNCVGSRNGRGLVAMLTQLINSSGISIGLIGTPETLSLFESAFQLARRSLGLQYNSLKKDNYFNSFCKILFGYQYVKNRTEITPQIIDWLYDHSDGITAVVVSLIHDAQELAISTGYEKLDLNSLNQAYEERLQLLHGYIHPQNIVQPKPKKKEPQIITSKPPKTDEPCSILDLSKKSKEEGLDFIELLKEYFTVEEIKI